MNALPVLPVPFGEHRLLGALLLSLYPALGAAPGTSVADAALLLHLGVFLAWQPIWQRDRPLEPLSLVTLLLLVAGFIWFARPTLLALWLVLLVGIVAGRSFASPRERTMHLACLGVLLADLLMVVVPDAFDLYLPSAAQQLFDALGLGVALILLLVSLPGATPSRTYPVDFFRGITVALTTALLATTAVLLTLTGPRDYAGALLLALPGLVGLLLLTSWLMSPQTGFGGFAQLWERSLLNIGSPFEDWLGTLSRGAADAANGDALVEHILHSFLSRPGIVGVGYTHGEAHGDGQRFLGEPSVHSLERSGDAGRLALALKSRPGPALQLHYQLQLRLALDFLSAKRREDREKTEARLRAVSETGARVTHDIKNLLQGLSTLTGLLAQQRGRDEPARDRQTLALVEAQLPEIERRLRLALGRLEAPAAAPTATITAAAWQASVVPLLPPWLTLTVTLDGATPLPRALLDAVFENLLDNLRRKQQLARDLRAEARLMPTDEGVTLTVCDTGHAMAEGTARGLFLRPVASASGFGIGLYQCAQLAAQSGARLRLSENRDGAVCVVLTLPRVSLPDA